MAKRNQQMVQKSFSSGLGTFALLVQGHGACLQGVGRGHSSAPAGCREKHPSIQMKEHALSSVSLKQ